MKIIKADTNNIDALLEIDKIANKEIKCGIY
jgi:hypothetical protein